MDLEGMFLTESSLQQLKPEFIVRHVLEAEERQWSKVHLAAADSIDSLTSSITTTTSSSAPSSPTTATSDCHDPGIVLLRHGTAVRKIHSYFSQLEFRKCCLHLAGRRTTMQSMRVVRASSSLIDDGSAKKSRDPLTFVTHLEDKELQAFKHAYLCAAYPVLAAPDPPSPFSPSPIHPRSGPTSPKRSGDAYKSSPYSLHDSGMEDAEDLAFIPSESICSHLQRAFHLTDEKFRDYRYLINKTYVRKSAQKLLAEELAGQLAVLENNCHPFYRLQDFMPPLGYDLWRKAEYSHITELLGKFWQFSLPFPRNAQDLIAELYSVHDDYRVLLLKLLAYERDFHRQAEEEGGMVVSPLSTASVRLLKEFGLRYGVGEQYRRILYLDQISTDFSPSMWYLRHVLSTINGIFDLLPPNRRALAIVRKEFDLLMSCLQRLATQASKAMEQMKSIFPTNKPAGGVELLITVLQRVHELRIYLEANVIQQSPSLAVILAEIVQGMFSQTYERCKTVIRTELRHSREVHVCPRMLNALIMEVRQEVLDYRNNFESVFSPYFDITVQAAKAFYSLLMKDVDTLCQQEKLRDNAIDLRMLALVHRLNQLDHDWSAYVRAKDQTWRLSFQTHVARWGMTLQLHIQDLVLETIAGDAFVTQQMQLSSDSSLPPLSSCSPHGSRSMSLTPSVNSAFSSLGSTPRQNSFSNNPVSGMVDKAKTPTPTRSTPQPRPKKNDQPADDFLNFADRRRHCASVPIFSSRPAIVRAISDTKMTDQVSTYGLHSAKAMEDVRSGIDQNNTFNQLTKLAGGSRDVRSASQHSLVRDQGEVMTQPPTREREFHILDSVSDCEDVEQVLMEIGRDSTTDIDSDSPDEVFTFPPLADVTDLNVSDSSLSHREKFPEGLMAHGKAMAKRKAAAHGSTEKKVRGAVKMTQAPTQGQGIIRSISQEKDGEEKGQKQGTPIPGQGQSGRRSCPHPVQRQTSGGSTVSERELHAFQPLNQRLHPAQVSALHNISTVSMGATESEHQFLQSIQSTVSFPTPSLNRHVLIPISGSAIDLLVLLQRTLGFERTLSRTIFPTPSPSRRGLMGVEGAVGEGEVADFRLALEASQRSAHLNVVEVLCQGISVYADNMLCLDLCAVPRDIAKRIIGASLVEHAMRQQQDHKIWGCRHQLQGLLNCYAFHNRKATYLSDRYEPITQKMCVRVNNVMACLQFLEWCGKQTQGTSLASVSTAAASADGRGGSMATADAAGANFSLLDQSTTSSMDSGVTQSSSGDTQDVKQQYMEQTRTHLMSVWSALCRLLAFRMNLFLRDGLTLLLTLKPPEVSIATCLLPVTTFLRSHLDALSSWLYSHCFRRVIDFLWVYIVQDIEQEVGKLMMEKGSPLSPHLLLQTLTHLMKFMNNCDKGITRELLLSQADDVVTKLQLFTLSTLHLIALYECLVEKYSEGEMTIQEDVSNTTFVPIPALHQLRKDLQTRHKCFSGAQLTHWIVRHADLFLSPDELSLCEGMTNISTEGAVAIAQQLLDLQWIEDLEAVNIAAAQSRCSSVMSGQQYPEVSLLGQLHPTHNATGFQVDADFVFTPTPKEQTPQQSAEPSTSTGSTTTPQQSHITHVVTSDYTQQQQQLSTHTCSLKSSSDSQSSGQPAPLISEDGTTIVKQTLPSSEQGALGAERLTETERENEREAVSKAETGSHQGTLETDRSTERERNETEVLTQNVSTSQQCVAEMERSTGTEKESETEVVNEAAVSFQQGTSLTERLTATDRNERDVGSKAGSVSQQATLEVERLTGTDEENETKVLSKAAVSSKQGTSEAEISTGRERNETANADDDSSCPMHADDSEVHAFVTGENASGSALIEEQNESTGACGGEPAFDVSDSSQKVLAEGDGEQLTLTERGKNQNMSTENYQNQLTEYDPDKLTDAYQNKLMERTQAQTMDDNHQTSTSDHTSSQTTRTDEILQPCSSTMDQLQHNSVRPGTEWVDESTNKVNSSGQLQHTSVGGEDERTVKSSKEVNINGQFQHTSVGGEDERTEESSDKVNISDVVGRTSLTGIEGKSDFTPQGDSETGAMSAVTTHSTSGTGDSANIPHIKVSPGVGISDFEDSGVAEGQDINVADNPEMPASVTSTQNNTNTQASASPSITVTLAENLPANTKVNLTYSLTPLPVARDGSVYNLDMSSICDTPLTFASMTSFPSTAIFENSIDKFYFMPPNPTSPSLVSHQNRSTHNTPAAPSAQLNSSFLSSQLDHLLQQLKKSEETGGLVEKCFMLKIVPVSVLTVLYARRKTDTLARTFLQQLSPALQHQVSSGIEMRSAECSVL